MAGSFYKQKRVKKHLSEEEKYQSALKLLHILVSRYHLKFPTFDHSEFESVGYVGIAEALHYSHKIKIKNWEGYAKICIQNAIRHYLRKEQKKNEFYYKATAIYTHFKHSYHTGEQNEENDETENT